MRQHGYEPHIACRAEDRTVPYGASNLKTVRRSAMRQPIECLRTICQRVATGFLLSTALVLPALAASKPPLGPDLTTPAVTTSSISATIQFGLPALSSDIEHKVPRRLATFDDRTTECWHRRIFGREVNVDCVYSGYVERVGSIPLRAEGGRITAATPLFGNVTAQGARGLASLVHGTAEGEMTVFASARPRLLADWSVSLDMSEGFRWTEPPTLSVLGFRINLQRYVEPKIREQLEHVKAEFERAANAMNIRGKAEAAWRNAFVAMPLVDTPPVWLQATPQSVAFSGFRARGNVLEGSVQITATTETLIGAQPSSTPAPTPLPPLGRDVTAPGRFSVIVPVTLGYELLRKELQDIMSACAQAYGLSLQDVTVYPSSGKIVAGLRLARTGETTGGDWVYLTAIPHVDPDAHVLQLVNAAVADGPLAAGSPLSAIASDPELTRALQQMKLSLPNELQTIITAANTRLSRPLGEGFRSEGRLTDIGLSQVLLLADGIRVDLRASGSLSILYGL
jgi:hypothetical protein